MSDIMSPISDPSDFGSVEHSRQSSVFEEREEEVPARVSGRAGGRHVDCFVGLLQSACY